MKLRFFSLMTKSIMGAVALFGIAFSTTYGHECSVAHTHIGINPTWRPADWNQPGDGFVDSDPTDNNKLWLFSLPPIHACATPGWPAWEHVNGNTFLVLTPVLEEEQHIFKPGDPNKVLYTSNFLYSKSGGDGDPNGLEHIDGWHSAFGPQGAWNLESIDANILPAWNIYLQRERVSRNLDEDDFFVLLPNDTSALQNNGDIYALEKQWLTDENAWGIHSHMGFYFWLDDTDDDVYIVLSVHDSGGLYQRSADFVIHFARTVIEPIPGDLNNDGVVDDLDLDILNAHWGLIGIHRGDDLQLHEHEHEDESLH